MGKERVETGRGRGSGVVRNPTAKKQGQGGGGAGGGNKGGAKGGGGKRVFYLALVILLVAGIATLSYLASRPKGTVSQADSTAVPITNQGHVIGSDTAPVEVVEFGDFECPACGNFANLTEPDVRARLVNTGLIRFRFMDYPLPMHKNTWNAHSAAWCAGEQGKFWEMHDVIFQNQDRWSAEATRRPDGILSGLARQVGLNMDQYENCVSSRKYYPQIQANLDEAIRRGVPSTPTFVIGNRQIASTMPYDEFKRYVDAAVTAARPAQGTTKAPSTKTPQTKAPAAQTP
jgi:protein-disulfide isomerase